jgi:hypothetical protein
MPPASTGSAVVTALFTESMLVFMAGQASLIVNILQLRNGGKRRFVKKRSVRFGLIS